MRCRSSSPGAIKPAEGRRRRRQRDGGPDGRPVARAPRPRPRRPPTGRPTASSPTTSRTRCWRRTGGSSSTGCSRRAPTWGSPGTATPTAASSSTTEGRSSTATSSRALLASADAGEGAGRDDPLRRPRQPRRPRHRPRARRHLRPQPGRPRLLQGRDARARRRLRRRGLGPLLLPRLLVRRLGHDPGAAGARAALDPEALPVGAGRRSCATATSSPARSTPRSPTARRR